MIKIVATLNNHEIRNIAETSLQLPELCYGESQEIRNHCRDLSTAAGALFRLNGRLGGVANHDQKIVQ
jgi:hypothetical protein